MTETKKHNVHSMQEPPSRARIVQVVTEASGRISQVLGEVYKSILNLAVLYVYMLTDPHAFGFGARVVNVLHR